MTRERQQEIIELIKREVKPALGCTEPVAVSLAVAKAAEVLRESGLETERVEVSVSGNILKNGMGVGVPGTGMVGLHIAAALGVTCGVSSHGLEVLKSITKESIQKAKAMLEEKQVTISLADSDKKLYINVSCKCGIHSASVTIEDNHDNITRVERDEQLLFSSSSEKDENPGSEKEHKEINDYKLTVKNIVKFTQSVPYKEIEFILESVTLNRALSEEEIRLLEGKVNEIIGQSLDVKESFVSREEAGLKYNVSKLPEDAGDVIRVISVGNYDHCPCIGQHVSNTSEIGGIAIISSDFNNETNILRIRYRIA